LFVIKRQKGQVEANSTGGQGSCRAVAPSDDDDDDDDKTSERLFLAEHRHVNERVQK
jgi:hypothetical protein